MLQRSLGQIIKFEGKLRLLEHGLLVAAKMLDDLRVTNEKKGKLEAAEDDDEPVETFEDYELRVKAFVAMHLTNASSSKRDNYKDVQVYQERKNVIHEFLKATIAKKCQNPSCGACVSRCVFSGEYAFKL